MPGEGAEAGYSGTPLPRKLGIRPGARVALIGSPTHDRRSASCLVCAIDPVWSGLRLVVRLRDRPGARPE